MFYSFNRLIDDLNIVTRGGSKRTEMPSNDSIEKGVREARRRIAIQMAATFILIVACIFLLNSSGSADSSLYKVAHIGFGIVIGYWFR